MEIEELSKLIESTYTRKNISLNEYNNILKSCVYHKEMEATVYIYDEILKKSITPNSYTYSLINKLHSKTIPESNRIKIKYQEAKRRLAPRRRIHKIMKGHNYSDKYNNAKIHEEKVRTFLDNNQNYKVMIEKRNKLAKIISKNCNISFNDARFIITSLKRKKYFSSINDNKQKSITDFFKKSN